MAAKRFKPDILPGETMVEVVKTRGDKVLKKTMEYHQALTIKKQLGWRYTNYQLGFCTMKTTN